MNPTLFRQLRDIEPDIARSYERVCRTVAESIERPREQQELIDDVGTLVDQLLGKIAELERNTKPHNQAVDVERIGYSGPSFGTNKC